jgi:hypothetical protein
MISKKWQNISIVIVMDFSSILPEFWYLSLLWSYQSLRSAVLYVKSAKTEQSGTVLYPLIPLEKQTWSSCGSDAEKWLEMSPLVGSWVHIADTIVPHPYAAVSPLRVCAPYFGPGRTWNSIGQGGPTHNSARASPLQSLRNQVGRRPFWAGLGRPRLVPSPPTGGAGVLSPRPLMRSFYRSMRALDVGVAVGAQFKYKK